VSQSADAFPPASGRNLSRRTLLRGALLAGGAAALPTALSGRAAGAPALVRSGRPMLTHGVQSGDVGRFSGTVWTRADRPSRMIVEISRRPDFSHAFRFPGALLTPRSDFTGKTVLPALPDGADIYYRVTAADLRDESLSSQSLTGHFRTVPRRARDVSFLWSGDLGGQGWGIDPSRGGYRIFNAMAALEPDFYICNGDNVYADDPFEPTQALPDGSMWHNVTTPEKSKVAETLDEYRGQYKYNLQDEHLRSFYANVAQIQQWDDHETHNNWYPGEILDDPLYTERRVDVLKYRSRQAWHEYMPISPRYDAEERIYRVQHHGPLLDVFVLDMRWYRDANSPNRQTFNDGGILGYEQARWLKRELARSTATWKVISNDMPLGIKVTDTTQGRPNFEAVSQDDTGAPLGREIQIAEILSFIKHEGIRNVVWLTTDVHYTAAQYFDPGQAVYTDFDPFWQFVSGPLHAGGFGSPGNDPTFGPQEVFIKAPPVANAAPDTDYMFFGQVSIDAASRVLTVRLRDVNGAVLWSTQIEPRRR
jgi:alkaline phosphatase D